MSSPAFSNAFRSSWNLVAISDCGGDGFDMMVLGVLATVLIIYHNEVHFQKQAGRNEKCTFSGDGIGQLVNALTIRNGAFLTIRTEPQLKLAINFVAKN